MSDIKTERVHRLRGLAISVRRSAATVLRAIPAPVALAAWILFYLARPFQLGFFHDDWTFIVAWSEFGFGELLTNWQEIMSPRPIGRLVLSTWTCLFGAVAFWWHAALIVLALCNAVLLYDITRRFLPDREQYVVEADITAACWLVMPWAISTTTWPVLIIAQVSVLFLLLSCLSLQAVFSRGLASILSALFFALSLLTYEVFQGQFFAVLFIGVVYAQSRTSSLPHLARSALLPLFALMTAQSAVLLYTALAGLSKGKGLHAEWLWMWYSSFSRLPYILFEQGKVGLWVAGAFVVIAAVGLIASLRKAEYSDVLRSISASIVLVAAIAVAVMVYSVGGYPISSMGFMSRTTLAVSVWLAFGIFFLAMACRPLPSFTLFGLRSARLVAVPLLLMLGFTYCRVQSYWVDASSQLDQFLRRAPVNKLAALPFGASLIYLGPSANRGLAFLGDHELGVGLALYHRQLTAPGKLLAPIHPNDRRTITWTGRTWAYAATKRFHWDGQQLASTMPGHWEFSAPVSQLFIWTAKDNSVREVEPGWLFDSPRSEAEALAR